MSTRDSRRLTINLPADVWDRLAAEAAGKNLTIGTHLKNLVLARDKKRQTK